jgi:diadenylate cyclase
MDSVIKTDMLEILKSIAPGTPMREALRMIINAKLGALLVIGTDDIVENLSSGGFLINAPFSPERLKELCKMDGAVILDSSLSTIIGANVQLMPNGIIPTTETGTRHRTANRVAQQTGFPVISISESMGTIVLYMGSEKHLLDDPIILSSRVQQALQTLEKYQSRFTQNERFLTSLEIEDSVTLSDVCQAVQLAEMTRQVSEVIHEYLDELGVEGRLLSLQWREILGDFTAIRRYLILDYIPDFKSFEEVDADLGNLRDEQLLTLESIAACLGLPSGMQDLESQASSKGERMLFSILKTGDKAIEHIGESFKSIQKLIATPIGGFEAIEGVTPRKARVIREGLLRIIETTVVNAYS